MTKAGQKRTFEMLLPLKNLISSVTNAEVLFIAGLDYGQGVEKHAIALRKLLDAQGAVLAEEQRFYPYEVIELGAHHLTAGHEREFVLCTLLVLNAVHIGFDTATDLSEKFDTLAWAYDALPMQLKNAVIAGYSEAESLS